MFSQQALIQRYHQLTSYQATTRRYLIVINHQNLKHLKLRTQLSTTLKINIENDPEYYKKLSERLEDIIKKYDEKWDELVQLLLNLRENIESDRKQQADDLGLTQTELAFYNILLAELGSNENLSHKSQTLIKDVVQSLVSMLDEATQIVDFFNKWDEQKRVKRDIKRVIIKNFDESLVKPITERFMDLAETKYK